MKIPIFPGKYHQNGGFSMAMLVYRRVKYYTNSIKQKQTHWCHMNFWILASTPWTLEVQHQQLVIRTPPNLVVTVLYQVICMNLSKLAQCFVPLFLSCHLHFNDHFCMKQPTSKNVWRCSFWFFDLVAHTAIGALHQTSSIYCPVLHQ